MPATTQRVKCEVGVKTWTQAILYVVNNVFRVWLIILQQRGLNNEILLRDKETLNKGLFTWLTTHHLNKAILEVFETGKSEAAERWDLIFTYKDPTQEDISGAEDANKVWKTYLDEVSAFMKRLNALPSGTTYRVVVSLNSDVEGQSPPEVPGWSSTTLKDVTHLNNMKFGEPIIQSGGLITTNMEFWGGIPDSNKHDVTY